MGCTNPQCSGYGQNHTGVGQSPEHPEDATGVFNFFVILIGILIIGTTIALIIEVTS
jgi:hypothetical protein